MRPSFKQHQTLGFQLIGRWQYSRSGPLHGPEAGVLLEHLRVHHEPVGPHHRPADQDVQRIITLERIEGEPEIGNGSSVVWAHVTQVRRAP